MGLFSGAQKRSHTVLVDVGSGSVAVGLVSVNPKKTSTVLAAHRVTLSKEERGENQIIAGLSRCTQEAFKKLLEDAALQKTIGSVSDVIVIVHAPWTRSQTQAHMQTFEAPTPITAGLMTQVIQEATQEAGELAADRVFERSVVRVALNGYPTGQPEGKRAEEVVAVVLQSDIDSTLKSNITSAIETALPGRTVKLRSATLAHTFLLKAHAPESTSYTIVDVMSEATSIASVHDGLITQHAIVPTGGRTILGLLQGSVEKEDETNTLDVWFARMKMLKDDACSDDACRETERALDKLTPELVQQFGETLSEMAQHSRLPNTLVLNAQEPFQSWFAEFLSRVDFGQFTVSLQPFTVLPLTPKALTPYAVHTGAQSIDTGILTGAAFVHTEHSQT